MDALEFLKAYNRICDSYGGTCIACPLKEEYCDLINEDCNFEKVVSVVEKWAKEHPVKQDRVNSWNNSRMRSCRRWLGRC